MYRQTDHAAPFDESAFEARLRTDASRFRRDTPSDFTARVMRELPDRTGGHESSFDISGPSNTPVRFARMLLTAAVVTLAVLSGMYIGAPWSTQPNNPNDTGDPPTAVALTDAGPTLIRRPRVTIDLNLNVALREEANRLLTRFNHAGQTLVSRLPFQGHSAPDESG